MAKPTKRWFERDDLLEDAIDDTSSGASLPPPGSGGVLSGLLPRLFTAKVDDVNFNTSMAGKYDPATYYSALSGNDTVVLPSKPSVAAVIGYDPLQVFHGAAGNDTITGGTLHDRVNGGTGNDRLFGNIGNDVLTGEDGHDHLFGGDGNDLLSAGIGIDYLDGGDGNDVIVATEDDDHLLRLLEWAPGPFGERWYSDFVTGGAGNDLIRVTAEDFAHGGDGNDRIEISEIAFRGLGAATGDNGDDVILGSKDGDWINTGSGNLLWPPDAWNAETEAAFGGFEDIVIAGEGNDTVLTMIYCNATVDTGRGDDTVFVIGLQDLISMGEGDDVLDLFGGACKADLGDGEDVVQIGRAAWDNPNVSEVTLGGGADRVLFDTNEWRSFSENRQPLDKAPWILDFHPGVDVINEIHLTNFDDVSLSLDRSNIYAFDIEGGSALYYDEPGGAGLDFCFARFAGVSASELQAHIVAHTTFV